MRDAAPVPFFRPDLGDAEIREVTAVLESGWLTTGPKVRAFEGAFAEAVGASRAVALNSATAALHLAVEALGLGRNHAVLVPTLTFAATAEVVRYLGATPILVDCDPITLNMDLDDAEKKLAELRTGRLRAGLDPSLNPVGIIAVHVGGAMMDIEALHNFARAHELWVVEDAAHAFPAAWRASSDAPWVRCGEATSKVTCFSFYANKTITTGEGGMAVTADAALADRIRLMSLHGLSHDAWSRYSGGPSWDYRIVAPGFKYNLTDIAAAIGIHQLARAEEMRQARARVAHRYFEAFRDTPCIELPEEDPNLIHSWHLFPIRLCLEALRIDRNAFIDALRAHGVGCSVHWRPLHLHPYYEETYGWSPLELPVASALWTRLVSLPIFSAMTDAEIDRVIEVVRALGAEHAR